MENQTYPKETDKSETVPTSPSPPSRPPPPSPTVESPSPPPPPPSLSSSPSHEFSFTISFHAPNSVSSISRTATAAAAAAAVKLSNSSSSCLDFDLSPADDIFFNGHLLPLHLVAHRPSDASIHNTNFLPHSLIETDEASNAVAAAAVPTSVYNGLKSPFFWLRRRLKKNDGEENNRFYEKQRQKKKKMFDFAHLWKKYTSLVEPFLFLKDWKEKREIRRSTQFSFSGEGRRRGWHEGMSAPASIWTSPANSGLLVTPSTTEFSSEELQNAVQAAIVHCKNSIGVEQE